MRWLFLLLLVLNVFYYVWHQQEAPLKAKEVVSLSSYKGSQQDIQLLSEAQSEKGCLYLGGLATPEVLESLRQRLVTLDVSSRKVVGKLMDSPGWWLQVRPESRHLLDETLVESLSRDFNDLKSKVMQCEGIATVE
ncbi:hypothetical protein [Pseudomonas putida]|uniref:Sporulation domain-containing protein n=1 Tax=Pseudomonas putida TaxID=303 RepID=A0A1Q9QZZ7_PSEPU|nr:hypothetical protein [Pseudomonas putida]OLS60695.1 hypothetical protein PSEMO_44740 [Pseudomonas putida]